MKAHRENVLRFGASVLFAVGPPSLEAKQNFAGATPDLASK
jgi:hypothetical protein